EARMLSKAKKLGIRTPLVYAVDEKNARLVIEFIKGKALKKYLLDRKEKNDCLKKLKEAGRQVALMHENSLIHGDLTTSNILLHNGKLFFIDFGLSKSSELLEEKAMDLVVFEKTFQATHSGLSGGWAGVLEGYAAAGKGSGKVFERMKEIKERARYL
ncbi:Kae1-associated serine/threonine protein kinase, partial [archaeon]|nr:Kae1-associated serine/threonine protein kinase [archaeon]